MFELSHTRAISISLVCVCLYMCSHMGVSSAYHICLQCVCSHMHALTVCVCVRAVSYVCALEC